MANVSRAGFNAAYCRLLQRYQASHRCALNVEPIYRTYATRPTLDDDDDDKPLKFTTSAAARESAKAFRTKAHDDDSPLAQTFSLSISLLVFLAYFGIFREENDLDDKIYEDIYTKVPDLKIVQERYASRTERDRARRDFAS